MKIPIIIIIKVIINDTNARMARRLGFNLNDNWGERNIITNIIKTNLFTYFLRDDHTLNLMSFLIKLLSKI
uniref:Uncharacterized protein n=1 Tax=Octopus bimaculoides TaxID=37653 RepID=A0A0L8I8G7_OCTBM